MEINPFTGDDDTRLRDQMEQEEYRPYPYAWDMLLVTLIMMMATALIIVTLYEIFS